MRHKVRNRFAVAECRAAVARKFEQMAVSVRKQAARMGKPLTFDQLSQVETWEAYARTFRVEQERHVFAGHVNGAPFIAA